MQLLVSICYPDGRPPDCGARMIMLDYQNPEAQSILAQLEEEDTASVSFPSGMMHCIGIEVVEGVNKEFGGRYIHALVQEERFEKIPAFIARLH